MLIVEDLHISFGGRPVVDGISFRLEQGEILGLAGESGSGKSVTASAIMGLLPVSARMRCKRIRLEGPGKPIDLTGPAAPSMENIRGKRIAMIFQEPMTALNPVMRCGKQVQEAISTGEGGERQVYRLLEDVGLTPAKRFFRAFPHELSGGQRQRVLIAMALANAPEVLIADEPTTALDVLTQAGIILLLQNIRKRYGLSVLFISHDLGLMGELCDRLLVLREGSIVETGPPSELFRDARHPYTRQLLDALPPLDKKVSRLGIGATSLPAPAKNKCTRSTPLLEVRDLNSWYSLESTWYGRTKTYEKAVQEVSFQLFEGECLGIVGASGSGKTTLGKALVRLVDTRSGHISFKGRSISGLSEKEFLPLRRQIQFVFQDPYSSLNPRLSVGRALTEPMKIHRLFASAEERREKAVELLQQVGLKADHFDRYPHEFSGGQRQRIALARALTLSPSLILLDESVSSLDVPVQARILNLLKDLQEFYGLSYIFITHDLSVVRFISDRLLVMNNGRIVEQGNCEQVFKQPATEYTRALLKAVPRY